MNVLSLFDGMSCGRVALERCGFTINKYYASEIDKYAITVAANNYLDTIHIGDVTKVRAEDLEPIDLLIGGSPCQGFSFAGKQLNFEDPRSKLFFEFVRLVKECKPKYFFLENVVMKKEYQDVISNYLGVEPIMLNSALVSAQSRKRLYWTNIPGYTPPEDKGILLEGILEEGFTDNDKSFCIDANYHKKGNLKSYFDKSRRQVVFSAAIRGHRLNKAAIIGRRLDESGTRKDYNKDVPITQCLEVRKTNTDKSNCLTTVAKDNVLTYMPPGRYEDVYGSDIWYRHFTPIECERLQTLPDNYTAGVSNSQRYKMLGNGWTVDAVCEFFKHIPKDLDLF